MTWIQRINCLVALTGLAISSPAIAQTEALEALSAGQAVAMIRHASAPGTGDPGNFRIDDCSTQRNLSDAGRDQARRIGDWFRARGIDQANVNSSQWCRCLETARLMALGTVTELPALNSFFADRSKEPEHVRDMKELLTRVRDEKPVIWVTHQVNITALTGVFPLSGEILIIDRNDLSMLHREVVR